MNYNYPQNQFQNPQSMGYGGYRMAPQYPQWGQAAITSQQVRPVSSIEEVRAFPIDFDGSVFYFADVANKRIYTKQINLDGTVNISLYEQKEFNNNITDQSTNSSYVTKQEFENTVNQLKAMYMNLLNQKEEEKPVEKKEEVQVTAAQPATTFVF